MDSPADAGPRQHEGLPGSCRGGLCRPPEKAPPPGHAEGCSPPERAGDPGQRPGKPQKAALARIVLLAGAPQVRLDCASRHFRHQQTAMDDRVKTLAELERKVLWLASWMIHNANHLRPNEDGLKVGGHQASSASLTTIMTALYFSVLRPQDRVAVKPHASPVFHAIQYLLGHQTRHQLETFRGYQGAQSYPSRTKDVDDVDFSTGSVGLGVAQTLFASLVQDYVHAHDWAKDKPEGRMIALVGDAELDEGNIFESILDGWKQNVRTC